MSLKYEIVKRAVKAVGLKNRGKMSADEIIAFKKKKNAKIGIPDIRDKEITISQVSVMGFPVLKMAHKAFTEKANLFIIGGGMVGKPQPSMIKKALRFCKETGLDLYIPYYPLCTEYPLNKAYEMICETYRTMLADYSSENISVIGLSSGGNLALGLIAYMNAEHIPLPRPHYIMVLSPGCGAVNDEERKRLKELDKKDFIISADYIKTAEEVMRRGSDSVPDYMIFLQLGDFTGCPEVTFIYGSDEVLYALAPSFEEAMKKYGVKYEMIVGEGMFHCYPVFPVVKEAKQGWDEMIRIMRSKTGITGGMQK